MSAYTGLYVTPLPGGIVTATVRTTPGNSESYLDKPDYVAKGVQPPFETLPSKEEYEKKHGKK